MERNEKRIERKRREGRAKEDMGGEREEERWDKRKNILRHSISFSKCWENNTNIVPNRRLAT